jgi:hypothetical protein
MPTNTTRRKKLTRLLHEGSVTTRPWLMSQGFDRHAIDNLVKSDQLTPVAAGVYTRPDSSPTWQGLVHFLQTDLGLNLIIGGQTALELLGLSHYVPLGSRKIIHLYGTDKLPAWLSRLTLDTEFQWHSEWNLLGNRHSVSGGHQDPLKSFTRHHSWKEGKEDLVISSPERALLEILAGVPGETSIEHADQLLQGMTSLSPRSLQALLEQCHNIKVRRLFFWLADRHQHPWLEKLHREKIDLGAGKRMLVKEGKLDKKYNITIPKYL